MAVVPGGHIHTRCGVLCLFDTGFPEPPADKRIAPHFLCLWPYGAPAATSNNTMEEKTYQTPETVVVVLKAERFICQSGGNDPGGSGSTDPLNPGVDD